MRISSNIPAGFIALVLINPRKAGIPIPGMYIVKDEDGNETTFTYGHGETRPVKIDSTYTEMRTLYPPFKIKSPMELIPAKDKELVRFLQNYHLCASSPLYKRVNGDDVSHALYVLVDPEVSAKERLSSAASSFAVMALFLEKIGSYDKKAGKIAWKEGGRDLARLIVIKVLDASTYVSVPEESISDEIVFDRLYAAISDSDMRERVFELINAGKSEIQALDFVDKGLRHGILTETDGALFYRGQPLGTKKLFLKTIGKIDQPANASIKPLYEAFMLELESIK